MIAGAIAAAAVAFVLHGFAAAIGLLASSAAPTWRDASFALVFLSGLYLLLAAFVSGTDLSARLLSNLGKQQVDVAALHSRLCLAELAGISQYLRVD